MVGSCPQSCCTGHVLKLFKEIVVELFTLVDESMAVAELQHESAPKEQQPTPIRPSKVLDRVALIEESDRRKAMVSGWYKRHQKKKNNVN